MSSSSSCEAENRNVPPKRKKGVEEETQRNKQTNTQKILTSCIPITVSFGIKSPPLNVREMHGCRPSRISKKGCWKRVKSKSRLSVALQYDCRSPCVSSRCAISARERSTRVQAGKWLTPHWPLTNSPFFKALNFLVRVTKLIMGASSHAT